MTRKCEKRSEGVRIANPARGGDGDGERRGREGGEKREERGERRGGGGKGGVGSFARTSHR